MENGEKGAARKKLSLYRVRQHFFELRKAGQGAFLLHGRFSLDEGQNVVDERLFNSIAAGIDQLSRAERQFISLEFPGQFLTKKGNPRPSFI